MRFQRIRKKYVIRKFKADVKGFNLCSIQCFCSLLPIAFSNATIYLRPGCLTQQETESIRGECGTGHAYSGTGTKEAFESIRGPTLRKRFFELSLTAKIPYQGLVKV